MHLSLLQASTSSDTCQSGQTARWWDAAPQKPLGSPHTQLLPHALPQRADVGIAQRQQDPSVCLLTDKMVRPAHGSRAGLCNSCGFQPYLSREGAACPARAFPLIGIFTCQWQADVQGARARPSLNSCSGEGVT